MGEHYTLFGILWKASVSIMYMAREVGAVVGFEWPTFCEYWKRDEVWEHMENMDYRFLRIHGCRYGLRSIAKATKGMPIKKPWTIATDCLPMAKYLNRRCRTTWHTDPMTGITTWHAPCAGVDTKVTEGYTDELADAIHLGHKDFVYGPNASCVVPSLSLLE